MSSTLPSPSSLAGEPSACLNCGTDLRPATPGALRPHYCPACGQETNVLPPTLREFAQQFGGAYFSTEGALWRTLKLLLTRPGELTRQYLAGRRKHYVLPLRLYLTISVIVLLALRLLGSDKIEIKPDAAATMAAENKKGVLTISLGNGRAGLRNGVFFCENLPDWVCHRIQRRIDISPESVATEVNAVKERFLSNLGAAMFLLVPSYAFWLWLVYFKRRMRYTEHLVYALHLHCAWFLCVALMLTRWWPLVMAGVLIVPVYALLAMKRVYGGRWWALLLRAMAVVMLHACALAMVMLAVGLWAAFG